MTDISKISVEDLIEKNTVKDLLVLQSKVNKAIEFRKETDIDTAID